MWLFQRRMLKVIQSGTGRAVLDFALCILTDLKVALVRDSLRMAKEFGFGVMQFNAVVATNHVALHLYEKVGFTRLGVIPKGFRLPDGTYADIVPQYIEL